MNIYQHLKDKEPLIVATHYDADGCYSAALLSTVFEIDRVFFPWIFGDYNEIKETVGDEEKIYVPDVVLDLGSPMSNTPKEMVIIDHHKISEVSPTDFYIHDFIPTTGIIYNLFKEHIPNEEKWKVVGGLVGDGQAEKVPIEIWDMFPILLETRGNIYRGQYGKFKEYPYPLYKHLSSPINASCRMGNPEMAYKIICRATNPIDILENIALKNDVESIDQEIRNIFREGIVENNVTHYCSVVSIRSDKRVGSRICSTLGSMNYSKTWVVINDGTKKFSIRGDLADYIGTKLEDYGFACGGHSGFWGGYLKKDQESKDIIKMLRAVLK